MPDAQPQRRERFRKIAVDLLEKKAETECRVTHWLVAVWPWSWVQHRPFVRSLAIALLAFAFVLAANIPHISVALAAKLAVAASALFAGFYNAFLVSRIFSRLFRRLRQFSLLPEDALARWYADSISRFLGKVNLYADPKGYKFRELCRDDPMIVALWVLILLLVAPSATYIIEGIPSLGVAPVSRVALYTATAFSVAWAAPFAFSSLRLVFDLTKLPVRYHPDMPACTSLKSVGTAYLQLASLYSITYAEVLAFAYLSGIPLGTFSLFWVNAAAAIVLTSVVVSQIAIMAVFREQKQRRLVEYSLHIEQAFDAFMRNPTQETGNRVDELRRLGKIIRKLDATGFSRWSLAGFLLLVVFDFGISFAYYYLAANNLWIEGVTQWRLTF